MTGQGDKDALAELYLELRRPIFLLAYSMLRSAQAAEDVVQDTFVKVMGAASSYRPGGSAKAWVLSIARNTAIDLLRREGRLAAQLPDELPDGSDAMVEADAGIDFLLAVEGMSDVDKGIVIYKVFAGLRHSEIAQALGLGEGAVRMRYRRTLQRLERFYLAKVV